MSTKIYDAYRIPKERDILKILFKAREMFAKHLASDGDYLKMIHLMSVREAYEELKKNPKNHMAKSAAETAAGLDGGRGGIDVFWTEQYLEKISKSFQREVVDVSASCSVFYDSKYWYLKFFVNSGWMYKPLNEWVKKYKVEDYHYQNQTDPPDDVPYGEYEKRDKKWEQLTRPTGGNYRAGFTYNIFDAFEFKELVTKYYYTGEKDVYKHLAYKFDVKMEPKEEKQES